MFNIKDYNTVYKSYLNYILYSLFKLFKGVIKYKNKNKKIGKTIKVYFNLISFKSICNIDYNNKYLIKDTNMYYSINLPIKINFNGTLKFYNINYNFLNIPKINQIGDLILNGYTRTPILYLKTTIKTSKFTVNNKIYIKYIIYLSGFNYLYIYICDNKYTYITLNNKYDICPDNYYTSINHLNSSYLLTNINALFTLLNDFDDKEENEECINKDYNVCFNLYLNKIFYIDILLILNYFIKIKYNKRNHIDNENLINKNVYSIYNSIFTLFKKSINIKKFLKYFKILLKNSQLYGRYDVSLFRESFLLNPCLHYTNQLNILAYLHNKFKINVFGYSNSLNSEFIVSKSLRNVQYNYLNIINILYTIDGEKCGVLNTLTTNTINVNFKFKSLLINKTKFNNKIYLDIHSKNFYKNVISTSISLKKNKKFKFNTVEILENGEFKILKLNVDYNNTLDKQLYNILNITELIIPFLFNNDLCRSLMGSKMHTQALSLLYSNPPYISTKYNTINNLLLNKMIISVHEGVVSEVNSYKITIYDNKNRFINYYLCPYNINDYNSYTVYKPLVWYGEKITKGKILAVPGDLNNFEFTLGFNNIVNYSFYYGYEHEDAIILNKKLVFNNMLTSLFFNIVDVNLEYLEKSYIDILIKNNNYIIKVKYTNNYNKFKSKDKILKTLFRKKRRKKRKKLFFKSTIVHKIKSIERLIKSECIFYCNLKDMNLKEIAYSNLKLFLVSINNINVGDKLCGRHGNKGTVSKIIEHINVPYTAYDYYPYIITSPIGAISRMNVGQFLEGACGNISSSYNTRFKVPINLINSNIYFRSLYNSYNNKYFDNTFQYLSKSIFRDFKTGYKLKNFTYSILLYYFKLMHTSKSKLRYKGNHKNKLPQSAFNNEGDNSQKFGEMEVWSLESHGAANNIKELSLLKTSHKFLSNYKHSLELISSKTFKHLTLELKSILMNIQFNTYYKTVSNQYSSNAT